MMHGWSILIKMYSASGERAIQHMRVQIDLPLNFHPATTGAGS